MTGGVAYLFKANGVTWVKGTGTLTDAHTLAVPGGCLPPRTVRPAAAIKDA